METTALPPGTCLAGRTATLLRLSGADARGWLQGQCTQDVRALAEGTFAESLVLDAKGRILDLFIARLDAEGISVYTTRPLEWAQLIDQYVVMEDVGLEILTETEAPKGDPIASVLHGHPHIDDLYDGLLPNEFGGAMQSLVSLDKGCYVGQEIVHRIFARGTPKTTFCLVESGSHLDPGTSLHFGEEPAGTVRRSALLPNGRWAATAFVRTAHAVPGVVLQGGQAPVTVKSFSAA